MMYAVETYSGVCSSPSSTLAWRISERNSCRFGRRYWCGLCFRRVQPCATCPGTSGDQHACAVLSNNTQGSVPLTVTAAQPGGKRASALFHRNLSSLPAQKRWAHVKTQAESSQQTCCFVVPSASLASPLLDAELVAGLHAMCEFHKLGLCHRFLSLGVGEIWMLQALCC